MATVLDVPADADGGADPVTSTAMAETYPTLASLHENAVSRTCGLNNGVCHNSKQYPDLHTASSLIDAINQPCNSYVSVRSDYRDACETAGDHLVIPELSIDQEIWTVDLVPADAPTAMLTAATLNLGTDIGKPTLPSTITIELHRGTTVFPLKTASVTSINGKAVTLSLAKADGSTKAFLDDRSYPWSNLMVRVADVNRNGVVGQGGMPEIRPGDPMGSFLMLRLVDPTQGDLMPQQCREWDDRATKALACWIAGLKMDKDGNPTNAWDPIDYAGCQLDLAGKGRCAQIQLSGFAAVESIVAQSCGGSSCHINEKTPQAGLDLSPGMIYQSLVGVASTEVASMNRVTPGDPDNSYFLCKIDPSCDKRQLALMPYQATALSADNLATIRDWITSGASAGAN
jgi:hypothetical protein